MPDSSNNPYQSPVDDRVAAERVPLKPSAFLFSIGVHIVAVVVMGLMLGSCFTSYSPAMTGADVQNAILSDMLVLALVGVGLHVYGIAFLFMLWKRASRQT